MGVLPLDVRLNVFSNDCTGYNGYRNTDTRTVTRTTHVAFCDAVIRLSLRRLPRKIRNTKPFQSTRMSKVSVRIDCSSHCSADTVLSVDQPFLHWQTLGRIGYKLEESLDRSGHGRPKCACGVVLFGCSAGHTSHT